MRITEGDFLIPVDKPVGPTSHDVVSKARKALGMRRIGHTGTLDPFASGLLVLCAGRATRLAEYITGMDKGYEAVACLGIETDTLDLSGEVTSMNDRWRSIDSSSLEEVVLSQIGLIEQKPPQFSAKKIDGEPMYRRARRGEVIPLPAVQVTIYELEIMSVTLPFVRFSVRCSSGTYVRAIARDIGLMLGCGAHLTELRRTTIGKFRVETAVSLEELANADAVSAARVEPSAGLLHIPPLSVDEAVADRLRNGQRVRIEQQGGESKALVAVTHGDNLIAIATLDAGLLRPRKVFMR